MLNKHDIKDYKEAGYQQPEAKKYDGQKPRMDLLDPLALEGLAKVLTFGAEKYAPNNWRNGFQYGRVIAAMYRHLLAIQRGEDTDPESGLPHIDHLGCCWMFLSNLTKTRPDLDDRWKSNEQSKTNMDNTQRRGFGGLYGASFQSQWPTGDYYIPEAIKVSYPK
jgi:hypothetical protein